MDAVTNLIASAMPHGRFRGDSVLEERFWGMMGRTADQWKGTRDQVEIGPYRVDSLVYCDGQKVVVEVDGQAYHLDKEADRKRDEYLLSHGIDAIIRIPFRALWHHGDAVFAVLARWYPRFKTDTEAIQLETLTATLEEFIERGISLQLYSMNADSATVGTAATFYGLRDKYRITRQRRF